ncbi:class I SAM-dependent methyltransferase [Candidatus Gracilibacteria bacterium]|nr:class I SAM-dependent methyltransferase [Candidatus Gracilibacteria bacterium]
MLKIKDFYNKWYHNSNSEQNFPNEEMCRFLSRCFSNIHDKSKIRVLEVGCGQGANLIYLESDGFDTYGIDISEEGIKKLINIFKKHINKKPNVFCQNMEKTNFESNYFDVVIDIFSSFCLNETQFNRFIVELHRILKRDGLYFSFTPSKNSDAFRNHSPAKLIDNSTLDGILRDDSPFFGNDYQFRFMSNDDVYNVFNNNGFDIEYLETLSRSYNNQKEVFEFLLIQAVLNNKDK